MKYKWLTPIIIIILLLLSITQSFASADHQGSNEIDLESVEAYLKAQMNKPIQFNQNSTLNNNFVHE